MEKQENPGIRWASLKHSYGQNGIEFAKWSFDMVFFEPMKIRFRRLIFPLFLVLLISLPGLLVNASEEKEHWERVRVKIDRQGTTQPPKPVEIDPGETQKENILIILDASGSMWGQVSLKRPDGARIQKCKIEIAAKVLEEYVGDLDEKKVNVGLRVFGRNREMGCKDSELIIPVGPLDKNAFTMTVMDVKPGHLGKTPIAYSLRRALVDISTPNDIRRFLDSGELSGGKKSIILITDGKGGCDSIEEVKGLEGDLRRLGVDIVKINVIALKVLQEGRSDPVVEPGAQLDMEAHLRKISRSTEGQYISIEAKPGMGIEEFERQMSKSIRIIAPTNTRERLLSLFYRSLDRINEFISAHMSATIIPTVILFSIFFVFVMRWFFQR